MKNSVKLYTENPGKNVAVTGEEPDKKSHWNNMHDP